MGYPLTFKRFVNRNRLSEGDYDKDPLESRVNTKALEGLAPEKFESFEAYQKAILSIAQFMADALDRLYQSRRMLLGDLRRLERDAVDEQAIAASIQIRTGIDIDIVAAVLKEFLNI